MNCFKISAEAVLLKSLNSMSIIFIENVKQAEQVL
jgi:hypothetical protein